VGWDATSPGGLEPAEAVPGATLWAYWIEVDCPPSDVVLWKSLVAVPVAILLPGVTISNTHSRDYTAQRLTWRGMGKRKHPSGQPSG
jgi:hypothetical protein